MTKVCVIKIKKYCVIKIIRTVITDILYAKPNKDKNFFFFSWFGKQIKF